MIDPKEKLENEVATAKDSIKRAKKMAEFMEKEVETAKDNVKKQKKHLASLKKNLERMTHD